MSIHALFSLAAAVVALATGIFAVVLDRRSAVWRLFLLGMLLLGVESVLTGMAGLALLPERALAWQRARFVVAGFLPSVWLLFSLVHARGQRMDRLRRWWPVLIVFLVVPLGTVAWPHLLATDALIPPLGEGEIWAVRLGVGGKVLHVVILLSAILILMNLERTYRGAVGTMRWRVKFVILGVGAIFAVRIHTATQALLYSAVFADTDILNAAALFLGGVLMARGIPRAREDHIDLYVSQAVLYRSATVLLGGMYLLVVGALAGLFRHTGIAVHLPVLTLLIFCGIFGLSVLLASDRVRMRTKRLVSRHFLRPQYDVRQVWLRFTEATAGMLDREAYCRSVARMASETFEALSVTIWLPGASGDRLSFGASTALPCGAEVPGELDGSGALAASWIRDAFMALQARGGPVDLDPSTEAWAVALKDATPAAFPEKGGRRLAVPLIARNTLTGIMVIGDRVSGVPFSPEELDLLGVIAGQAGTGLLNADLSDRLLQLREMEAFQTMSAFFVHDLKNTASTLSLMLENLPRHFADPAFREDALKAIAKCAGRIDGMIQRLSALRHTLEIRPGKGDLNVLVRHAIERLAGVLDPEPALDLSPLPPVSFDAEQLEKVLTNLVLNAFEAMNRQGRVCVRTRHENRTVTLSVSDEGIGMSRRFMEESLFRPFRSTKTGGLGIGLFQSRMIVEAHGGRIDVESEEERGSTFHVRLPVEGGR